MSAPKITDKERLAFKYEQPMANPSGEVDCGPNDKQENYRMTNQDSDDKPEAKFKSNDQPPLNPFDPARLAIKGNPADTIGIRRILTQVPVRKPNRQEFVRAHPEPQFKAPMAILELKAEMETYVVIPEVAVAIPGETKLVTITTAINRQGNVFYGPCRS